MINLRYHIVSITAVFLALGIGVALGSTFLDRATVNVLDRNIRSAEERIRETNAENDRLRSEVADADARDEGLIILGTDRLLGGELADQRVLVVAAPGVADERLDALRSVLERSGADLRGTLELSDRLSFDTDEVDEDLAADLGLEDVSVPELRDAVNDQLVDALAAAGVADPTAGDDEGDPTTTTTTTAPEVTTTIEGAAPDGEGPAPSPTPEDQEVGPTEVPAVIEALLDREYASLDPGPGRPDDDQILDEAGYRYVYIGADDADAADNDLLLALLPQDDAAPEIPAVVVTSTQDLPAADEQVVPTIVALVRASEPLAERYPTIDDVETFSGMTATIFSVADLGEVAPGHYGQADGASAVLPPLP